ncbi:2-keto-4-pentenoate hydratase [Phocicoccus pinnipedialis]|uniref:2-hydroxyhexa-2,4-dienoate hydratase n=1 Tax=Phocicoccus pinnipedialis TaxID=110845 RepID=A0A6V7R5A4_9BACL|nr:hydratase [Jeotgalicoccus pinnipedialis]MBP1939990.1 2-oxo-hept-3-ene-1,7-dioate hydratase [Jeotgalicoccus pinnipedialis]CAD2072062.1 2-hydroxyhexa-2,4-dienoate hydratase [Jeotgalicoccus pinnipedialis]
MAVSNELFEAYKTNTPVRIEDIEVANIIDAYDNQEKLLERKKELGEKLKGYKISLTSEKTQKLFNSTHPLYGAMTDKQILESVSLTDYNEPLLELELVFNIVETLDVEDTLEDICRKCTISPGIEIPDGRYKNWFPNIDMFQVISDAAVSGGVVIGEPKQLTYANIASIKGTILKDDEEVKVGYSTEVMDHPAEAVKWLVHELDKRGKNLEPGMFVSSGTFITPFVLEVGSYTATYENVGSVSIEVTE